MYSHLKSNNSTSVILNAIICIIIMVAVICTGYKFHNRKQSMLQHKYTTIDMSNTWFVQLFIVKV
jgi:hypothetical protein